MEYKCIIDCPRHCILTDPFEMDKDEVKCVRFPEMTGHLMFVCNEAFIPEPIRNIYNEMFYDIVGIKGVEREWRGVKFFDGTEMSLGPRFEASGEGRGLNTIRREIMRMCDRQRCERRGEQ